MLRALYTAATGMQAQQVNIDTIANNIANVNTTGFKQGRAEFQDLLYQTIRPAGTASSSSRCLRRFDASVAKKPQGDEN